MTIEGGTQEELRNRILFLEEVEKVLKKNMPSPQLYFKILRMVQEEIIKAERLLKDNHKPKQI